MQLALVEGDRGGFERRRRRVTEIAALLEEKAAIPAVKAQLAYLAALQEVSFWEGITLDMLEEMRLRLRGLVAFLDRRKRTLVYTDFEDELLDEGDESAPAMPKMTGAQYEKKVKECLRSHLDHIVIHRLRANMPLTPTDLEELERTLAPIGAEDGGALLQGMLARSNAPSLAWFVRTLVGMDRVAAQAAFSAFLNDRSLTPQQIRFVETIIDQLTAHGVMEPSALYEPPFTRIDSGGPDALFDGRENVVAGIFETLDAINSGLYGERTSLRVARGKSGGAE